MGSSWLALKTIACPRVAGCPLPPLSADRHHHGAVDDGDGDDDDCGDRDDDHGGHDDGVDENHDGVDGGFTA